MTNPLVLNKDIIPADFEIAITKADENKKEIARLANEFSGLTTFQDHQTGRSENTNKAQHSDLTLFGHFINGIYDAAENTTLAVDDRLKSGQLFHDPAIWQVITHGLVKLFRKHLLDQGFAISSINRALASIRKYASLAAQAGQLPLSELILIQQITAYKKSESKNIDRGRPLTRKGNKKETSIPIPSGVITELLSEKPYPETAVGKRDRLIISLLLDLGLRASTIAVLKRKDVDLKTGQIQVYRQKTDKTDRLTMTAAIQQALSDYLEVDLPPPHPRISFLLRAGNRTGVLRNAGMSPSAVSKVMTKYGKLMAIQFNMLELAKLSSHDSRHQWVTDSLDSGIQLDRLKQAGGWSSPDMIFRYANMKEIANEGAVLDRSKLRKKATKKD